MDISTLIQIPRSIAASPHAVRMMAVLSTAGTEVPMHDNWQFWCKLPAATLRGIWFDGIGSFPEKAILLSGNIPEDAVCRRIERLRTRKTFGEGLMSKFALSDPRASNDKLVSVLRGGDLVPEARDAAAANPNFRRLFGAGKLKGVSFNCHDSPTHAFFLQYYGDLRDKDTQDIILRYFSGVRKSNDTFAAEEKLASARFLFQRADFDNTDFISKLDAMPLDYETKLELFNAKAHQKLVASNDLYGVELFAAADDKQGLLMSPALGETDIEDAFKQIPNMAAKAKQQFSGYAPNLKSLQATVLKHPRVPRSVYDALVRDQNPFIVSADYANSRFAGDILEGSHPWLIIPHVFVIASNAAPPAMLRSALNKCCAAHSAGLTSGSYDAITAVDNPNFPLESLRRDARFRDGNITGDIVLADEHVLLPIAAAAALRSKDFAGFLGENLDWPVAANALLLEPSTSARKLETISTLHPELRRACAVHQNGYDLPAGGDPVIEDIRNRTHGIDLAGSSSKGKPASSATQIVI